MSSPRPGIGVTKRRRLSPKGKKTFVLYYRTETGERRKPRLAEYLTALPPREVLEKKLHEAIRAARERLSPLLAKSSTTGS